MWRRIVNSIYTFMDDFTEEPEEQNENEDGEPLTVKQLGLDYYLPLHISSIMCLDSLIPNLKS